MQQTEETNPPQARPYSSASEDAAAARVTVQQLVSALTAIEARHDEDGRGNTVAIGEALRELGVSVTADQVLAEVRRQEAESNVAASTRSEALLTAPAPTAVRPTKRRFWKRVAASVTALTVLGFGLSVATAHHQGPFTHHFSHYFTTADEIAYNDFQRLVVRDEAQDILLKDDVIQGVTRHGVYFYVHLGKEYRSPVQRNQLVTYLSQHGLPTN